MVFSVTCRIGMIAMAVALITASASGAAEPTVKVAAGLVAGARNGAVEYFKGIPYAAAPVGDLRWRPTQPAKPWVGERDATKYGPDCAQTPFPFDDAPSRGGFSEDCLFVNVWRPADSKGQKKLPVMLWIHGGGYTTGGTSPAVYDGTHFAEKGVVFVSLNYRLGRFGFFAFPALSAEDPKALLGNYAFMDQIAALKWIKANIAAFGGDPDNVTIFGESAGGMSVHTLLASPLAKGLFNKAVIESGAGRSSLLGPRNLKGDQPNMPSGETVGVNFAKINGIEGTGSEALAVLRELPVDKVIAGLSMGARMDGPPTFVGPMIDGRLIVEASDAAYKGKRQAKVAVMVGANSADIGGNRAATLDEAATVFGADKDKARAVYAASAGGDEHIAIVSIGMDRGMSEPARFTAQSFADQGVPAYEFRFAYVSAARDAAFQASPFAKMSIRGAQHASEIPYVFETVKAAFETTPADEAMAKTVNTYWVNFAKTGNPNGAGLPTWPSYKSADDQIMIFAQDGAKALPDPWRARLDLTAALANK